MAFALKSVDQIYAIETPIQPGGIQASLERLRENSGGKTPVLKEFSPAWVRSLAERGEPEIYTRSNSNNFEYIGMPVGGIGAGMVYLGGDGKLWWWDIFNVLSGSGLTGENAYQFPVGRKTEGIYHDFQQGFVIRTTTAGSSTVLPLDRNGPADIEFKGQYPVGKVTYRDAALPVKVELEAFSPFIPGDLENSSYPATIMEFTVTNTSNRPVTGELAGYIENAAYSQSRHYLSGSLNNEIISSPEGTILIATGDLDKHPSGKSRKDIVFDDFESGDLQNWTAVGEAFADGPYRQSEYGSFEKEDSLAAISKPKSSSTDPNMLTGTLSSKSFTIVRNAIRFQQAGSYPGNCHVELLIDGKVVRTTKNIWGSFFASQRNRFTPVVFDVRDYEGKSAIIRIVDESDYARNGHIKVDNIVFTDDYRDARPQLAKLRDSGSMALALAGRSMPSIVNPSIEGSNVNMAAIEKGNQLSAETRFGSNSLTGSLGSEFSLKPGQSATFTYVLAWHFPNFRHEEGRLKTQLGREYASRFESAEAVAVHLLDNLDYLAANTRLWRDTWYDSTLPYWFLDRTFLNTSILASSTSVLYGDGRFYGWEGYYQGSGTCTHVWGYVQAPGRLFPEIERRLREMVDYNENVAFNPDTGMIQFRSEFNDRPAVDGHSGVILRTLLAHQMSPDDRFLKRVYPVMRKAMNFLVDTNDPDRDGILTGKQHNTLDGDWYGKITWLSLHYTAALRAAADMADEMSEPDDAREWRTLADRGREFIENHLYNGEYFIHIGDPDVPKGPGSYSGNEYSQLFGQSWAYQVGLGQILDPVKVRTALNSLWKYNFSSDVGPYREEFPGGRWYAMPGEGGLIATTWPRGGSEVLKLGRPHFANYLNECQNGYEYAATSLMMWHGLVDKALAHTKAMHERYQGAKRNPWNEIEWGSHYSRSMASYGLFTAISGFEYNGPKGYMAFSPRLAPENFRAAFTSAEGWGTYSQHRSGSGQSSEILVAHGSLRLERLGFDLPTGRTAGTVSVKNGNQVFHRTFEQIDQRLMIELNDPIVVATDGALTIEINYLSK